MPKQIPADQKRVPLNCLVHPSTKDEIKERAINGQSQGEVVDRAISALYRETGTAWQPPRSSGKTVRRGQRVTSVGRPARAPLLKPKDQKK